MKPNRKQHIVNSLLEETRVLLVIDNLETIKPENLDDIWNFIDLLPEPSKVLLTSREYHQNVPQTLRVENMEEESAEEFTVKYGLELGLPLSLLTSSKKDIARLSSGLPIVIKSIVAQLFLGKRLKAIEKSLSQTSDPLVKFCFEEQIKLLNADQKIVILTMSLAEELLDHDKLSFLLSDLLKESVLDIVKELRDLSLIRIFLGEIDTHYSVLPLIQMYVVSSNESNELISEIRKRIAEYYSLKDIDIYHLLPIEERAIERGALIPRKLVDKAMAHASSGEYEQAEADFKRALASYVTESFVWYMYGCFQAQYLSQFNDAIKSVRKAYELEANYIYKKKIGDFHLRLGNYQAAIKNYQQAMECTDLSRNRAELLYSIANAEYSRVKILRREIKINRQYGKIEERNKYYESILKNLELYIKKQPHIYDGKLVKILRMKAEAHFGLRQNNHALECINKAIDLSEYDDSHVEFRHLVVKKIEGKKHKFEQEKA